MTSQGWLTAPVIYPQVLPLPGRSWPRPPEKGKLALGRGFLVPSAWKSSSSLSGKLIGSCGSRSPSRPRHRVPVPPASPVGDLSSLCCKTPAQVGSSFFSFVNYLASLPGAVVFAWPRLSAVAWPHSRGSLPAQRGLSRCCCRHHAGKPRGPGILAR